MIYSVMQYMLRRTYMSGIPMRAEHLVRLASSAIFTRQSNQAASINLIVLQHGIRPDASIVGCAGVKIASHMGTNQNANLPTQKRTKNLTTRTGAWLLLNMHCTRTIETCGTTRFCNFTTSPLCVSVWVCAPVHPDSKGIWKCFLTVLKP